MTVVEQRKSDSSSSDSRYRKQRSASPYLSRRHRRRSSSSSKSRSPTNSMLQERELEFQTTDKTLQIVKRGDNIFPSAAMDRRTRRYKQSVYEAETSKRKKEGKKSFYLTVDKQGKPFGPGMKAWYSDINKLAKFLDPSCTHIRKQTYEDMCIFRERLNENFEYSDDVNEDFLRSLVGKAVTRRRSELISLIRKEGSKPPNFDDKIWKRLEKIANSRQREERTQHGRYANSCRKTMGRTGSLGVHGIREKLREEYGRSPDPDEVGEEMKRHKVFGKKEEGRHTVQNRKGKARINDVSDEESMHNSENSSGSEALNIEGDHYRRRESVRKSANQVNFKTVLQCLINL